jgi:pyruvate,water dikinase
MKDNKWILSFEKLDREDIKLVGGKCANLGEMTKIGIPVPPGFAITTTAYNAFLKETGAEDEIRQCLSEFANGLQTNADFQNLSRLVKTIIASKDIPAILREAISKAYEELCQRLMVAELPVAIRSSGVAEDMPMASFAGQYDSYLGVRGPKECLEKVKLCWASAFNSHCIAYRVRNNLRILEGSISVAIQKMIKARSAGVAFTIDPLTGEGENIILEGNWGFGESVVQGLTNPDRFVINKKTFAIEEKMINQKLIQFSLAEKGVVQTDVPMEMQCVACLTDNEAIKIAELVETLESHYGKPIDIEWVVDSDLLFPKNIFLVQVRPVTIIPKKKDATQETLNLIDKYFVNR